METNVGSILNEMQPNLEPKVTVIEDGVVVDDPNRMNPNVMQFVMLAKIAREATQIRKYIDDKTPNGDLVNYVLQVTDARQKAGITNPAQSVSFINDGPNAVAIWINTPSGLPKTLAHNETYHIDMDIHQLFCFYLQCNTGETAQIRAVVLG